MNIVFWQNALSIHQAPLIRELAKDMKNRIIVVAESEVAGRRSGMGWGAVDYGSAEVLVSPGVTERDRILKRERLRSFHVFSGFGVYPATTRTMRKLIRGPHGKIAIVTESWETGGVRGLARTVKYRWMQLRMAKRVDFFLCIGTQAVRQYGRIGVPAHQLYPFAYFVADRGSSPTDERFSPNVELLYVGELAPWKDPTSLVTALAAVDVPNWRLRVVGEGELADGLRALSSKLGLIDRITFLPFQPNSVVRTMMTSSDLLVLPSLYDGWGAVASEALLAGTKVLVSSGAGASQMIGCDKQGWVFAPGDVDSLAELLTSAIRSGKQTQEQRDRLAEWADHAISPRAGARYLEAVLCTPAFGAAAIRAPWMARDDSAT